MKVKLKEFFDRGILVPFELKDIPFEPKRIFWVTDTKKGQIRGDHAHYTTQQIFICIQGKIEVELQSRQKQEKIILKKNEYVLIDKLVWGVQKYLTGKDIALVLCSTKYDPSDYITSFRMFHETVKKR